MVLDAIFEEDCFGTFEVEIEVDIDENGGL